jgi:uncharacterized phage protein (TIGR01671 family)
MNKNNINVPSAGTTVDSNSNAQNHSVSQPNANTNVVGSHFNSREIKFRAWLIPDDDFESELPYMTYDLAFEDYAPVNEQLKSVSTLMQYTGLKDKNGKEIYEGDILKYQLLYITGDEEPDTYTEYTEEVIFEDGQFTVEVMPLFVACEWGEVIGNIFENPELLQTLR